MLCTAAPAFAQGNDRNDGATMTSERNERDFGWLGLLGLAGLVGLMRKRRDDASVRR